MSEDLCEIIDQASRSLGFNSIIFVKMLSCLGGAAFLLRAWIVHGVRFLGHKNSRVLFHAYYSTFFMLGLNIGTLYLIDFVRLRYTCVRLDFRLVITLRGLTISSILSAHLILIIMSLERLYSSLYPAKFERSSAKRCTVALALTVVTGATSFVMWNLTDGFRLFTAHFVAHTDAKVPLNAGRYVKTMATMSITSGCALVIFCLDIYLNFYRKMPTNLSLGASYQFSENRRVILVLMPIEIVDCIFSLITSVSQLLYAKFVKDETPLSREIFLEATTLILAFPLVLAIIIEWKVGRRKRVILPLEPSIDHFENLQRFWG